MYHPLLEDNYQPRNWVKAHEMNRDDPSTFSTGAKFGDHDYSVCSSDSEKASRYEDMLRRGVSVTKVFLFDVELMEAGHENLIAGGMLNVLAEDWNGHSAGKLAMTVYTEDGYILYVEV